MKTSAYLKLSDGTVQAENVSVVTRLCGNVSAVYIKGESDQPLDASFGAGIDISQLNINEWMADCRYSEFWCRPEFGTLSDSIPDETQCLIARKTDGGFAVIMPVVSEVYKCVLKGGRNAVTAALYSWYEGIKSIDALAFVFAEGDNPFALLSDCAKAAVSLLGNGCRVRKDRSYPEIFEYLGWCSWDAFEIRVDEDSLVSKCREFQDKEIPVKWAIIDDMWAEVHDFYGAEYPTRNDMFKLMHASRLYSYEADPVRFPDGLKSCIDKIKLFGIKVGMWHPTTGYWKGLDPDGNAFKELSDCLILTADGRYIHSFERDKALRYYTAVHDYFKRSGADFVKIDNQSMTRRFYKGLAPVGEASRQFHEAMETSAVTHFGSAVINCMGMASEDMWNRSSTPISRCSDDFQPENRKWFAHHITQCSYNCLVQGQLYFCDWDMWWSDDGQAAKNSVLRAVSGGPVYVSDKLGRSRAEVLRPLILPDGRVLRCCRPGMPSADCLTENPETNGRIFKIQNMANGCGIAAVFNIDSENRSVCGTLSPKDVDGLDGDVFVLYEHFSRSMAILRKDENITITLGDNDDFRLYVIVPYKNGYAPIGITEKFVSPLTYKAESDGKITSLCSGEFACVKDGKLLFCKV